MSTNQTVLITGGTGDIGHRLTQLLLQQGYKVAYLSRSNKSIPDVTVYQWDIKKGHIDPQAITTADHIIHLAGAGIADERWTDQRKDEILKSRTQSTELLAQALTKNKHHVKSFIGASAIGYYGADTGDRPMTETSVGGTDFMAQVVRAWERSEEQVAALGIRTVKLRTGVALTMTGGALPKLAQPVKLGAGAPIGSGQQYISWIHLDDLCRMYVQALNRRVVAGSIQCRCPQSGHQRNPDPHHCRRVAPTDDFAQHSYFRYQTFIWRNGHRCNGR